MDIQFLHLIIADMEEVRMAPDGLERMCYYNIFVSGFDDPSKELIIDEGEGDKGAGKCLNDLPGEDILEKVLALLRERGKEPVCVYEAIGFSDEDNAAMRELHWRLFEKGHYDLSDDLLSICDMWLRAREIDPATGKIVDHKPQEDMKTVAYFARNEITDGRKLRRLKKAVERLLELC